MLRLVGYDPSGRFRLLMLKLDVVQRLFAYLN